MDVALTHLIHSIRSVCSFPSPGQPEESPLDQAELSPLACIEMAAGQPPTAAEKASQKGYSEEEIQAARERVEKVIQNEDDDEVCELAEDDLCMLVATPEEKSKLIKQLMAGHTSDKEDRAIVSILQSAEDKVEYVAIIDGAGGRAVGEELDDEEAKKKFDRLAGAYDRVDLAQDKNEAEKTRGALTDPAKQERLLGGADTETVDAEDGFETGDPADDFISGQQSRTAAKVSSLDRRTVVETVCENGVREKEGKPLINPREIRKQVNEIMNDESLSAEQRESKVKQIQNQNGLSEYTMRNIATQPVAKIYDRAKQEAAQFAQQEVAQLRHEVEQTERVFGKSSPEAAEVQGKLQRFEAKMAPYLKKLEGVASALNDMFPPPKSFWDSVGGFLGDLVKSLAPALLNLIPGVGSVLYGAYQAVNAVVQGAKGNLLGMVSGLVGAVPGVGSLLGGASQKLLDTGSKIARGALGMSQAVGEGNPLAALGAASGLAGDLGAPALVSQVAGYATQGAGLVNAVASGNPFAAANGAVGIAGDLGTPRQALGYLIQGTRVLESLASGNPWSALQPTSQLAQQLGASRGMMRAFSYAQDGADALQVISAVA